MNSRRLIPILRHLSACNLQLAESGQAAGVAGVASGNAHHSGDRHAARTQHDVVAQRWFLPFAGTVEVEQSQVAVPSVHTLRIPYLWFHDYAKLSLVRTLRVAEEGV